MTHAAAEDTACRGLMNVTLSLSLLHSGSHHHAHSCAHAKLRQLASEQLATSNQRDMRSLSKSIKHTPESLQG